jgi:hypothetical protein
MVAVGAIGSSFVVATTTEDSEIGGGAWAVIAVVGWWFPLLAAALLVALALVGLAMAFVQAFVEYYVGGPTFGQCFFWEFLLPVATALLFVAAYRQRTGRAEVW